MCECVFVKALTWSVGATIDGASRKPFHEYLLALTTGKADPTGDPAHKDFLNKNRQYDQEAFGKRTMVALPDFTPHGGHEVGTVLSSLQNRARLCRPLP